MDWLQLTRGKAPLILSLPHTGTEIPDHVAHHLISEELALHDTDWHIEQLYSFAAELGATVLRTAISRTVIDVNRDPSGVSLYPGQATTELCPTTTFDGRPLYQDGWAPDAVEIAARCAAYHQPYHAALAAEIARLRQVHPHIVVFDAHSIRSIIPRLFEGELPVLNVGTNGGVSAAKVIQDQVVKTCAHSSFSSVLNGRFKGGWITRSLGNPAAGVSAVQLEIACRGYLDEVESGVPAFGAKALPMQSFLHKLLNGLIAGLG